MWHSVFLSPYPTLFLLSFFTLSVSAQPATLSFTDCTSGNAVDSAKKINVSTVYGQIVTGENLGRHLNLTVIGNTGQEITPISNDTQLLSTMFTTSSILSFNIWENNTFFCSSLRPPSPLPAENSSYFFCPLNAGPMAFSAAIPLGSHRYELLTINTRLRIVDTSSPAIELGCVDISATPLDGQRMAGSIYGNAGIIFWVSVAIAIAYWVMIGLARIVAAWGRGGSGSSRSIWSRLEGAGYILASAISGERFSTTPALLRFSTPSMRDIIFHTQFCAALGMVAVQWPVFVYPMFAQTAWSALVYNVTLAQGTNATLTHWNPLRVQDYNPPSDFADQLNDPTSAIFVDTSVPNALLTFPNNTSAGMASFAAAVGLRPQDLFGVCLALFLSIIGGAIAISLIVWGIDRLGVALFGTGDKDLPFGTRSPNYVQPPKDSDKNGPASAEEDGTSVVGHFLFRSTTIPLSSALGRKWWKFRIKPSSFHGSILHGNLVRILILFHLPVTVFASYQFTNAHLQSSLASVVLASISFAILSVGIPVFLVARLYTTATNKLYDETRTLMTLGPLYNLHGQGSQLFACIFFANNLIYGITIGCGQRSGTAQAIIILVTEVGASLSTSIWLPWGRGATMGLISFFFCVARITVAVLLVILTPTVSVAIKIIEGLFRIVGRVPFDRSKHSLDSGLLGVLGLLGCCKPAGRRRRTNRRSTGTDQRSSTQLGSQQQFAMGNKGSTPPSSTHGTPSVLRPEQALRPYREDSDDESGFIMGSWQPFPQAGYGPIDARPPSPVVETPPKSGFARVGGGRAHYDSPYAIQGSTAAVMAKHEFPSVERVHQPSPPPPSRFTDTPTNRSTVTVNHAVTTGLPPGAMSPAQPSSHVRTKSQTAIIEDASVLFNLASGSPTAPASGGRDDPLTPPAIPIETDDSSSDVTQPRRTHWFPFRKTRRMSEGSYPVEGGGGRSFAVLRDKRPSGPTISSNTETPAEEGGRRSFVVLRGNNASDDPPSAPSRSTRRLSHA
ncbi:hypothetical protein EW145_g629 [Phellinidium pouzarii]|uniref:TRP C-terminal domain-containing protein n=1 Tax=Phellinidium pouzarii TaxID=167371 RepID=A0A4S4LN66_9AGAM|nr:hypothetical protein EW145_g629 [Phellinidium pouzarii]